MPINHLILIRYFRQPNDGWYHIAPLNAGLWAQIRWSDLGKDAVKGERYPLLSPMWIRFDCFDV